MSKTNRPRRPTRRQKGIIEDLKLITLYNKHTGKTITRYKKENIK